MNLKIETTRPSHSDTKKLDHFKTLRQVKNPKSWKYTTTENSKRVFSFPQVTSRIKGRVIA